MSLFDDATAFMKNKPVETQDDKREELIKRLRADFENATRMEIERALDKLAEREEIPSDYGLLLKKIRIWLED